MVLACLVFVAACSTADESVPTAPATSTTALDSVPTTQGSAPSTSPSTTTQVVQLSYTPTIDPGPCPFDEPVATSPQCGTIAVPEDRTDPTGRQVVLAVAIFPPQSGEESRPPLVYLEGGPGGEILEAIPFAYSTVIEPLNDDRSVVVFDQRGTGYSEPSLACPETEQLTFDLLADLLETEELTQRRLDALAPCQARWAAEGIDLGQYNSAASAADVDDIRRALGYLTWDLYGVSYGTRLALTIMRDHPDGIRSVVLDSTYPPEVDGVASILETADRALNEFYQACVADTGCSAAYGDIESLLFEVIASLNDEPVQISVGGLFTGDRYAVVLDGDSVLDLVFQSLYSEELLIAIPEMLADIRDGRYLKVEFLVALVLANQRFFAIGQNFSVQCNEEVAFADPAAVDAATQRFPQLVSLVEGAFTQSAYAFEFCALWGTGVGDAIEAEPVFSDIPALVVAGQFDPITPPSFGRAVADRLENGYFVEYPGLGHGVAAVEGCPISVTLSFLDDPTSAPDVSCAASMPPARFTVYLDDTSVELVEVAVNLLGEGREPSSQPPGRTWGLERSIGLVREPTKPLSWSKAIGVSQSSNWYSSCLGQSSVRTELWKRSIP